ncbi:MAG: HAD family hydrolase [Christensenellales bacterium]|jgi:predicted HAD superfamily Cof-like phosphohydrolase
MSLNDAYNEVKAFHAAFNAPHPDKPVMLTPERAAARADWMREEINEFLDAKTLTDQADAMIDLLYFALGTLVEMSVPPQKLFDIVQKANMTKLWPDGKPHYREDGKVIKPAGWEPPEPQLEAVIQQMLNKSC